MRFSTSAPFIALTALAASYAFPKRELNFTTCNEAILPLDPNPLDGGPSPIAAPSPRPRRLRPPLMASLAIGAMV